MKLAKASEKKFGVNKSKLAILFKLFATPRLGIFQLFLVLMAFYLLARMRWKRGWAMARLQILGWYSQDWRQGSGVNMYALLPDFVPYTEVNRHKFDKPGWLEIYP